VGYICLGSNIPLSKMIDAINSQRAAATASDLAEVVRSQVTGQAVEAHRYLRKVSPESNCHASGESLAGNLLSFGLARIARVADKQQALGDRPSSRDS